MFLPRLSQRRRVSWLALAALTTLSFAGVTTAAVPASDAAPGGNSPSTWAMFGQNVNNTASAPEMQVNTGNVKNLKPKWTFTTGGDVSARAAVAGGVVYFPDWSGHLYAVKSSNGKLVWSKNIVADYLAGVFPDHPAKVVSRTSPALDVATNTLYIGTQRGAYLLAINASTGALRWATQLDAHPLAIDTASPVVLNGVVYVGTSSLEEGAAVDPTYPCCSFRGSVMAVDALTGAIKWKTYTVPNGYNGGAVWGSTIVPDPSRHRVYATTGNNYFTPTDPAYQACIAGGGNQEECNSPDDHLDSVLALNMSTGAIEWADRFASSDDWTVACFFNGVNCPVNSGPDFDFGSGVQLFTIQSPTGPKTIIGAGQKSGVYSAMDPATGRVLWATQVGPGSSLGGMEWGSATDGKRIYVQIANFYGIPNTMSDGSTTLGGSWAALDPADGHIIWQVADPYGAVDLGPMTVANGVVYAPSMAGGATDKNMVALNAATGATLWSFAAGGSVNAGASIAQDTVFWGSGYANLGIPGYTANNKFYAFSVGGQ
jgi:polyvinyl alcohol dehydrogenase (cytochrome)